MADQLDLPVPLALEPMEAEPVAAAATGEGWQYEPKWDGFRCLAFRSGDATELRSKSGQPLTPLLPRPGRFAAGAALPEAGARRRAGDPSRRRAVVRAIAAAPASGGEPGAEAGGAQPAELIVFDGCWRGDAALLDHTLVERRARLEQLATRCFGADRRIRLSPATRSLEQAGRWLAESRGGLDGLIAKRLDAPISPARAVPCKNTKQRRSADCVVGGFRLRRAANDKGGHEVGSLLLGLYDDDEKLHHVGFTATLRAPSGRR